MIKNIPLEEMSRMFIAARSAERIGFGWNHLSATKGEEGKFAGNNGILAFVDPDGVRYVGLDIPCARNVLRQAGYIEGAVYVPYSNSVAGEPIIEELRKRSLY